MIGRFEQLPEDIVQVIYSYADPETTYIYSKVIDLESEMKGKKFQHSWFDMSNNKLCNELHIMMVYIPLLFKEVKPKSNMYMNPLGGKHVLESFLSDLGYFMCMNKITFLFAMILCGFRYKLVANVTYANGYEIRVYAKMYFTHMNQIHDRNKTFWANLIHSTRHNQLVRDAPFYHSLYK